MKYRVTRIPTSRKGVAIAALQRQRLAKQTELYKAHKSRAAAVARHQKIIAESRAALKAAENDLKAAEQDLVQLNDTSAPRPLVCWRVEMYEIGRYKLFLHREHAVAWRKAFIEAAALRFPGYKQHAPINSIKYDPLDTSTGMHCDPVNDRAHMEVELAKVQKRHARIITGVTEESDDESSMSHYDVHEDDSEDDSDDNKSASDNDDDSSDSD